MKKHLLLALGLSFMMVINTSLIAGNPYNGHWGGSFGSIVYLRLIRPEINPEKDRPRSPIDVPQVEQTDHTLYFLDETDFVLNLYSVDDDEELTLEYSTMVPAETEAVMLPSDLSGTYVIEVIRGDQHFIGEIEL